MFAAYSLMASYVLDHQIYPLRLRAAQPHLNAEELGNVLFLCPPLEVQEAIVSFLDRKLETMDKLVAATSLTLGLLHERRGALITAVVSGSRKVSEVS
jgi:type I restriction enzyme S subunit